MSPAPFIGSSIEYKRRCGIKVLVVTGSSGGHIFPALGFLEALKEKNQKIEVLLVLPKSGIKDHLPLCGLEVKYISAAIVKPRLDFENIIALLKFLKTSLESLFLFFEFRPDIVVGFGSLNSLPLAMFAWFFRVKILVHEQNVMPGRANRLLAKFADKFAVSFERTKNYLNLPAQRLAFTGNPLRKELKHCAKKEALDFFGFPEGRFTILVMGGSQGSHNINMAFLEAVSLLKGKFSLQVVHLTGEKDYQLIKGRYKELDINAQAFSFLSPMQHAYNAADLVISRSGATTISEIIFFQLPAVFIPYPYAYEHQLSNALALEEEGCAVIIKDEELSRPVLPETLQEIMSTPARLDRMRSGFKNLALTNAGALLSEAVISLESSE